MTLIAPTLQAFFTDRLTRQLHASPRTIASYRDTLTLLLRFAQENAVKQPAALNWDDLDEALIGAFLEHLETKRGNSARSRNLRLTAIRSLYKYAALRHPEHAAVIARVLSIPPKRFEKRAISFLNSEEATAVINAPDQTRWEGRRDRAMLTLTIQTGLRVSELIALDCADITLGTGAHVHCRQGKGRKQRSVPLTAPTQAILATWLKEGLPALMWSG
jgi:site-specific recombinase XerD